MGRIAINLFRTKWGIVFISLFLIVVIASMAEDDTGSLQIAEHGEVRVVIIVPSDWMQNVEMPADLPKLAAKRLHDRRALLQESIRDLAHYLGKMTGQNISIVDSLPEGDQRIPIYIGSMAKPVFGAVGISKAGLYGFRVVVDAKKGIGLFGESEIGTSYAIYEFLDRLGCRWFMPTELGEVIPNRPELSVPFMDKKLVPVTENRSMWQGGRDFHRRNRMGPHRGGYGNIVWLAYGDGSIQRYFSKQDLQAHLEWRVLQNDGTPHPWALRMTHPAVANHVARNIIRQLEKIYEPMKKVGLRPGYSLTPKDARLPTEDPFERESDPDPRAWESASGRWSVTDRHMVFFNRVAKAVRKRFPDVAFGDYAYVNKSLPPIEYPVPDDFRIVICPIDYNRYHPMDWTDHPNGLSLRELVAGWEKAGARVGAYWYGINLAEISAPSPFITKWVRDIKILLDNDLHEWMPETMNGWDSMMPGYYLAIRMTFHGDQTAEQILDELWIKFYGAAAKPMERYWMSIDQAYIGANEYSGSPYGYLKIFKPEVMEAARLDINEALSLCSNDIDCRRVKLIDESFGLFEQYMKMRQDWAEGNVKDLEFNYQLWRNGVVDMVRRYKDPADSTYVQGRYANPLWSDKIYSVGYRSGSRMERKFVRIGNPMVEWKWQHNPESEIKSLPWAAIDYDDTDWPVTHVVRDTWSSLGHHFTMTHQPTGRSGRMVYRSHQELDVQPEGKKIYLWIGSTDGSVKLYVNGESIPFSQEKAEFDGYSRPATFDISNAVKVGRNQFTILAERHKLNEIGTGGLMGPVIIYREK